MSIPEPGSLSPFSGMPFTGLKWNVTYFDEPVERRPQMQVFQYVVWKVDEDGTRVGLHAFKERVAVPMSIVAKTAHEAELKVAASLGDVTGREIEIIPFGKGPV